MFCRTCQNKINEKAAFCIKCGVKPNTGKKYCSNCSVETKDEQVMCIKCGVSFNDFNKDSSDLSEWYHKDEYLILAFVFCLPLGIYAYLKRENKI